MLRKFKSIGVRFRQVARLPGGTRTFRMDGPREAESEDARHFGVALRGRHGLGFWVRIGGSSAGAERAGSGPYAAVARICPLVNRRVASADNPSGSRLQP
jgi:hypothetical protein